MAQREGTWEEASSPRWNGPSYAGTQEEGRSPSWVTGEDANASVAHACAWGHSQGVPWPPGLAAQGQRRLSHLAQELASDSFEPLGAGKSRASPPQSKGGALPCTPPAPSPLQGKPPGKELGSLRHCREVAGREQGRTAGLPQPSPCFLLPESSSQWYWEQQGPLSRPGLFLPHLFTSPASQWEGRGDSGP